MNQVWQFLVDTFHRRQMIINLIVFANVGFWTVAVPVYAWQSGKNDIIDAIFIAHNCVMIALVLLRRQHVAVSESPKAQGIALVAFFSGLAFNLWAPNPNPDLLEASRWVILTSLVVGMATLLNLGRSFGILVALREVRTTGMYALVRHPMYATDILMRLGIVMKHPCAYNVALGVVSSLCYVWRAVEEERFLSQYEEYRQYRERVCYRFIPGVF